MKKITDTQLFRYICTGIVNTVFGTCIMFGLYNLAGCSYWISSAANYILAGILSYILNRTFTFRYRGGIAGSGVRFAVNNIVCYLTAYGISERLAQLMLDGVSVNIRENIAMFAGMCLYVVLNYTGQKFFVFGVSKMDYRKTYEKWIANPHLDRSDAEELKKFTDSEKYEAFYKRLRFGTAGMRGLMGLGTNRLNKYTVRMAAKGLADMLGKGAKVAVAFDTRNGSDRFAEEAAGVLAAAGLKALLFDRYSPVPLLSFAVRDLGCDGGIVITASHNLPPYNGFKVYDGTGCQMSAEDAAKISANIEAMEDELDIPSAGLDHPGIERIGEEVIGRFMKAVQDCSVRSDAEAASALRVVYTSLHGSGREYVLDTLASAGFDDVILVSEQAGYDGNFPTVKKPNPEDPAVFRIAERYAKEDDADIIIGTDPDSDRLGTGVMHKGSPVYLTGNQMGTLFIDFICRNTGASGKKLITSIVTGDMGPDVAAYYGAETIRTFTGFKDLAGEMNKLPEDQILMAYEESYGYLAGTHIRDKDGISSALIMCQMAAYWKQQGMTLVDALEALYEKHGYYIDDQISFVFEGSEGAAKIADIMERLRKEGKDIFSDVIAVREAVDYSKGAEGSAEANVLKYIFEDGSWLAARPSGTEPKIKFYYCIKGSGREAARRLHAELKEKVVGLAG